MTKELTFTQAFPFIEANIKARHTPALLGEPGIGKSSLIEDLARVFKTKVFTLAINQLADRADLTGVRMVKSEDTGSWSQKAFPHFKIMEAIEYGEANPDETPILFLDEFNRASSDITSAVLSLHTERAIGSIKFPENLRLIIAGNDKGNVTSVDDASISRFSVYKVIPDIETFMSIQTLNPYVHAVLTKYPTDLMADDVVMAAAANDDDDEENAFDMANYGFEGSESFKQITRPRTITYVSEWLDALGLDKSGSDKEKEILANLFTSMATVDEHNVFLAGIEAHVGPTSFSVHLFDEVQSFFNSMLSNTQTTTTAPLLSKIRPKQDFINELNRAKDEQSVSAVINSMSEDELLNATVWLLEIASTREIDNNSAVESFMINAPHEIVTFNPSSVQSLMTILSNGPSVSQVAVKALLATQATSLDQIRMMIGSIQDNS